MEMVLPYRYNDGADTAAAARIKPKEAEVQKENAGVKHAATLVRFKGGTFRVVLTPAQFVRLLKGNEPDSAN